MSTVKKFLLGQVEFRVQGLPQGCLNKLRSFNISNIYYDQDMIIFNAPLAHVSTIKKMINNFDYEVKENYNLFRGINYLLNHLVLVVAVIAGLIAFCLADMAIYDIKVQSNNAQVTSNITQYLDKIGIKKFIWKSKIKNNLASDLVENFDQIAHANVKISGNTLVINVVTAANENSKIKTNFYAKYDAVIKNIITYSGTALVTVGDVVKKGDLLVADAYPDSAVITGEVAFINDDEISRLEIWII